MTKALTEEQKAAAAEAAAKKAEDEAAADEADEEKVGKGVVVSFEGGQTRTYTGKDAKAKAAGFISKRPADRAIVK